MSNLGIAQSEITGASSSGGGSGSSNTSLAVNQTAHGFSVNNAIYYTGTQWALAQANSNTTLGIGIVTLVSDANDFTVMFEGYATGLSGFTAGQYYFVSDATAGLLTSTEPSLNTSFSNPLFFALTASTGVVLPFRPSAIFGNGNTVPVGTNVIQTTPLGSTDTTFTGFSIIIALPAAALLCQPSRWKFSVALVTAASFTVGAGVVYKCAKNTAVVSSVTTLTWGGSATPTLTAGETFSDVISLQLDTSHDFFIVIFFTTSTGSIATAASATIFGQVWSAVTITPGSGDDYYGFKSGNFTTTTVGNPIAAGWSKSEWYLSQCISQ